MNEPKFRLPDRPDSRASEHANCAYCPMGKEHKATQLDGTGRGVCNARACRTKSRKQVEREALTR